MNEKLFYTDPCLQEMQAEVLSCEPSEKGWLVTLSRTVFYPEGGGQACDLGTLGSARVLDVQERGDQILHLCDRALEAGTTVTGKIDWARRFDLMQQHTGEHIVSGLVYRHFGLHNVGFHLGADVMQIDFDGSVPADFLPELEHLANEAVFRNLPIRCWYPSEDELPNVFYRTKKALPWPVRIVEIPGVDSCACCGVHVERTGEIGYIKLLSCVKFHQGVRIELCCGSRAVGLMQGIFDENRRVSQAFSAKMLETGAAAEKMNELLAAEKLRANTLQSALLEQLAQSYQGAGNVICFRENLDGNQLRELADKISRVCGGWAAVISGAEGAYNICILHQNGDVKPLAEALKAKLSARGGGKPGSFQGSVPAARAQIDAVLQPHTS